MPGRAVGQGRLRAMSWKPELDEIARRVERAKEMGGEERVARARAAGRLDVAVERAVCKAPEGISVQIEVESEIMADRAVELGARFLLLDNLDPKTTQRIVARHGESVLLESSGGIDRKNLRAYAETGIARISMGALTHSVQSCDVALEIDLLPQSGNQHSAREPS